MSTAASPPHSPLPKRQKPNPTSPSQSQSSTSQATDPAHPSIASTMSDSTLPPTTNSNSASASTSKSTSSSNDDTTTARQAHSAPAAAVTRLSTSPPLLIKKLSDKARLPTRGSAFAAGYDIYAARETVVPARGKALVETDLSMAVPEGTYGRIAPRSGLAAKHMIDTGAGVIDADYRGQVKVLLFNHAAEDFPVREGDRVAQLVLERIYTPDVLEVQALEESVRGEGGFGSTG